jgi:hypothetical protein
MQADGKQDATRKDGGLGGISDGLTREGLSEPSLSKSKRSTVAGDQYPLFLFACRVEWHRERNLKAYQALVAGLDDSDKRIRAIAETMLHRCSPRPQRRGWEVYRN